MPAQRNRGGYNVSDQFQIHFAVVEGKVVMTFSGSYSFIYLPPALAREVAANLVRMADQIEPQKETRQ
jgi:hypothetical protein